MPLKLELGIEKCDLLAQENPSCTLAMANTGDSPLTIPHPFLAETMPVFRVINLADGQDTVHWKPKRRRGPESVCTLGPKESVTGSYSLLDQFPALPPGDYQISGIYAFVDDGPRQAESPPVRVSVRPVRVLGLSLDESSGSLIYGVWLNAATNPPQAVHSLFYLESGGVVEEVRTLGTVADLRVRPALSSHAHGSDRQGHWVAWIEGTSLRFVHTHARWGDSPVGRVPLTWKDPEIVAPLFSEPMLDPQRRPAGAALILSTSPAGFGLGAMVLASDKATAVALVDLSGPRPAWIRNHVMSSGTYLVTYLQTHSDRIVLSSVAWSKSSVSRATELAQWEGEFVQAGSSVDEKGAVRGILVRRVAKEGRSRTLLGRWTLKSDGKFVVGPEKELRWPKERVDRLTVRVNESGLPAVLFAGNDGSWSVYWRGRLHTPPPSMFGTVPPLDMAFAPFDEPVVIAPTADAGFRIMRHDGSPLPPPRH